MNYQTKDDPALTEEPYAEGAPFLPNIGGPVDVHGFSVVFKECRSGRGRLRDHHRRSVEFGLCLQ